MALDESKLRSLPVSAKPYKVYDSKGLYIIVRPEGTVWWRLRYRWPGKGEQSISLGVYPKTGLIAAREGRDKALELIAKGINPAEVRFQEKVGKLAAAGDTFGAVATEWLALQDKMLSTKTIDKAKWILNSFVLPVLNNVPIATEPNVLAPMVFSVLRGIEGKGFHETTHRAKFRIGQILRYAIGTGRAATDVTVNMRGALITPKVTSRAAITVPRQLAPLLSDIWDYQGKKPVSVALKLAPMLFVRPGELRQMEWREIDFENKLWTISAPKMKPIDGQRLPHYVPLSRQAIELLTNLKAVTGCFDYVFPNDRGCVYPMSNGAVRVALDRLGYSGEQTGHGFRATARTLLDEVLGFRYEWIDLQLAHKVKDSNGRAYNRTKFLDHRSGMMQVWSDYLDSLRIGTAT